MYPFFWKVRNKCYLLFYSQISFSLKFTVEMSVLVLILAITSKSSEILGYISYFSKKLMCTETDGDVSTGSRSLQWYVYFCNVTAICWASRALWKSHLQLYVISQLINDSELLFIRRYEMLYLYIFFTYIQFFKIDWL